MRLSPSITLSKGVATLKEITPADYVLALHLAIEKYGNVSESEVEPSFWLSVWLEQGLIALQGDFTEAEFSQVGDKFVRLNASLYQQVGSGKAKTSPQKHQKKLLEIAHEVQTECAVLISQFNYQNAFSYGFTFIQHLQKLHKK
jgi:hypothetical protein